MNELNLVKWIYTNQILAWLYNGVVVYFASCLNSVVCCEKWHLKSEHRKHLFYLDVFVWMLNTLLNFIFILLAIALRLLVISVTFLTTCTTQASWLSHAVNAIGTFYSCERDVSFSRGSRTFAEVFQLLQPCHTPYGKLDRCLWDKGSI